ncbi:MAG: S1C family serine protease, partial [Candidatus Zixiibacteriota bacterium]
SIVTIEAAKSVSEALPSSKCDSRILNLVASGIVFDSNGYVLVAASTVINRENIFVMSSGQRVPAEIVGVDYQTGLALLKTDRPIGMPFEALDDYRCIGQLVIAVGNSFGLHASPSLGFCAGARSDGTLQFSAAISSGSVGGGIFDLTGKLIGAITGGIGEGTQAEAGLAVPSYEIPGIVGYLKRYGDRQAGYLGVTISDIEVAPPIELRSGNLMTGGVQRPVRVIDRSVIITEVIVQSPAAIAKVAPGDLIINIDGDDIYAAVDFLDKIRKSRPGTILQLELIRQNKLFSTIVEIGQRPGIESDKQISGLPENNFSLSPDASIQQELLALKKAMLRLEQRISDNK